MILRVIGAIAIGIVVLGIAGQLFGSTSWDDIKDTCLEEMAMDASTCECIVRTLQDEGYEPEDVEGEEYPAQAMSAVMPCIL